MQGNPPHMAQHMVQHMAPPMAISAGASPLLNLSTEQRSELLEYWGAFLRRKFQITGFALAVAALAWVVSSMQVPYYRSTVTVLLEAPRIKTVSVEEVYDNTANQMNFYSTQMEIMKSPDVMRRTVDNLKLVDNPVFDPRRPAESPSDRLLASIGFGRPSATVPDIPPDQLRQMVAGQVRGGMSVEAVRGSSLVRISFESTDPQASALVANGLADAYIDNDLDSKFAMTQRATDWMNSRLVELKGKLVESERALQNYRDSRGIVNTGGGAVGIAASQLSDLTGRLIDARAKRTEAQISIDQINKAKAANQPMDSIPAVARSPEVSKAKDSLLSAERKFAEVSDRYGKEHPKYLSADAELRSARDSYKRQVDIAVATIQKDFETARAAETAVEQVVNSAKGAVASVNRGEFQLQALEREVAANKQLYDMFMGRLKETNATEGLQTTIGRVLEPAGAGYRVRPNTQRTVMGAFWGALFFALVLTVLLERLDSTLKSSDDVEKRLHLPSLGSVPVVDKSEGEASTSYIRNPRAVFGEAIRTIRTGVLLSSIDSPRKIIALTSSLPGEGKSTISAALALAHAQTKPTLLIDSDMRKPTVGPRFGFDRKTPGLSDLISGSVTVDEVLRPIEGSKLKLIAAGTTPPNPLELILSPRYQEVLAQLQEMFEVIIIDTPPVKLVSDAVVISSYATGLIYVTKADATPYRMVQRGMTEIRRGGGRIIGVVLNQLDFEKADRYYGENSGYSAYGYQGAYYGDDTASDSGQATGKGMRGVLSRMTKKAS